MWSKPHLPCRDRAGRGASQLLPQARAPVMPPSRHSQSASISFDDFESALSLLENASLAQGSPLSPILFIFFNSTLVNQPVDYHGGASAFIDDYFRWRAGKSAEKNLRKLQEDDIPRINGPKKQVHASPRRKPSSSTSPGRKANKVKGS